MRLPTRIGREWIPRVNMTREILGCILGKEGTGDDSRRTISRVGAKGSTTNEGHTKAPSATTKGRHEE